MPLAQLLIVAAGALAAGLALGPIISLRSRRQMTLGGVLAVLLGGALQWPPSRTIVHDALSLDVLGLDLLEAGLFGLAAVLLPLVFGAALTGP